MPPLPSSVRAGALGAALVVFSACGRGPDAGEGSEPGAFVPDALLEPAATSGLETSPAPAPTVAERRSELVIVAGGDVNLGRGVGQRILADPAYALLDGVKAVLSTADLVFANLESPLSDQGGQTSNPYEPLVFTGPPAGADVLANGGVGLVSVANNHTWDYGFSGFLQTLDNLDRAGVAHVGASRRAGQEYAPTVLTVGGWSVATFAVTEVWNPGTFAGHEAEGHVAWANLERLVPEIQAARARYDIVVVSYHGGKEYAESPALQPLAFSRHVMSAGADVVLGHHPHVPQGVRWFEGRAVLYSLGNLVFGLHRDHPWTGRGYLARLRFTRGQAARVEACPYVIDDGVPRLIHENERDAWLPIFRRQLVRLTHRTMVGGARIGAADEHGCMLLESPE